MKTFFKLTSNEDALSYLYKRLNALKLDLKEVIDSDEIWQPSQIILTCPWKPDSEIVINCSRIYDADGIEIFDSEISVSLDSTSYSIDILNLIYNQWSKPFHEMVGDEIVNRLKKIISI